MAGIDSSIYNRLQTVQLEDPNKVRAEMAQLQGMQNQNKLFDMNVAEKERSQARENRLMQVTRDSFDPTSGKLDPNKYRAGLGQAGDYQGLQKFETDQLAQDKSQREAQKEKIAGALKQFEVIGQIMGGVRDQQSYEVAKQQIMQVLGPEAAANIPPNYDPAAIADGQKKAMSVKEQLEQEWKKMEYTTPNANARLQADTSTANSKRSANASMANAAATRSIAQATKEAAGMQRDRDTEMKIADDYRAQSKPFKEVGEAYKTINATLDKASTSPAATLAAATKFMKLLDPGSVVRESELGMAMQASGVFDRATNYFNVLQRGRVLTPNQVADFKNITEQIYVAAQSGQKQLDTNYTQQAKTYGLRPEMIVQDLGQNAKQGGATSNAPASPNIDDLLKKYGG